MDFILSWPNQIVNVDRPTKMNDNNHDHNGPEMSSWSGWLF
jgi:hypothetical protein